MIANIHAVVEGVTTILGGPASFNPHGM